MQTLPANTTRRAFFRQAAAWSAPLLLRTWTPGSSVCAWAASPTGAAHEALYKDWLARWERNILGGARNRYCDREMGEEIGWLVSPFLNGFFYGGLATTPGYCARHSPFP
jgi:hypothetical protein